MADTDDKVVVAPDLVPPPVRPYCEKLHEIEEHQENGYPGKGIHVVGPGTAVFRPGVQSRHIPFSQADHDERCENGEFEEKDEILHVWKASRGLVFNANFPKKKCGRYDRGIFDKNVRRVLRIYDQN